MSMIYDLETNTISHNRTDSASAISGSTYGGAHAPTRFSHHVTDFAGALGLLAIAYIHLLDVKSKLSETPYLGVGYVLLIGAALATAVLLVRGDARGWKIAGALAASTFIGFCLSRTTGLPRSTDDIGNWSETLGIYSLIVEAFVVTLAATRILPAVRFALRRPAFSAA
jgi:hypothetical protein